MTKGKPLSDDPVNVARRLKRLAIRSAQEAEYVFRDKACGDEMTFAESRAKQRATIGHTLEKSNDRVLESIIQIYERELEKAERTPGSFEQYRDNLRDILVMALAEKMRRTS